MNEKILILDFGSQYTQLIARRIRELNVYCEIFPFNAFPQPDETVKGIVLSGSPSSVRDANAPVPSIDHLRGRIPLLGICYGAQFLALHYGGDVAPSNTREYGRARLGFIDAENPLLRGISPNTQVWMSHGDTIMELPEHFHVIASTADIRIGAFAAGSEKIFGLQFHPEVYHTTEGSVILKNFVSGICGCRQDWTPLSFIESTVAELQNTLHDDKVVFGLSGGVDSSVAAVSAQPGDR